MEQIKELHDSRGDAIGEILQPTFEILTPLLIANASTIKSVPAVTHSYGSHPRQQLDVYEASSPSPNAPILVFFYGGGFIHGNKVHPRIDVVYANLGAFFALRGITTIIADYRRVNDATLGTGEDAVYPSGGEDVAAVLAWLNTHLGSTSSPRRDVFLLGNSAGGVHSATFLFDPEFEKTRRAYVTGGDGKVDLKGAVLVGCPFHFKSAHGNRSATLKEYYGANQAEARCPYGLLEALKGKAKTPADVGIPKLLVYLSEFDPEDEIVSPNKDFVRLYQETFGQDAVKFEILEGHNHISTAVALSTGEEKAERWGNSVVEFIKSSQ